MPDVEFMRVCPDKKFGKCALTGQLCNYMKAYQTCPTKNEAERNSF